MNPSEKLTDIASAEDQDVVDAIVSALVEAINQRLEQAAEACEEVDGHMSFPDIIRSFKVEAKNINVVRK